MYAHHEPCNPLSDVCSWFLHVLGFMALVPCSSSWPVTHYLSIQDLYIRYLPSLTPTPLFTYWQAPACWVWEGLQ